MACSSALPYVGMQSHFSTRHDIERVKLSDEALSSTAEHIITDNRSMLGQDEIEQTAQGGRSFVFHANPIIATLSNGKSSQLKGALF